SVTTLGSTLFNGSDRWLGIEIGSDGEMTPRLRIVSVPYAIYANDSENLDGHDSSYFMPATTDNWVDITGDTMTGNLVVNADINISTGNAYQVNGNNFLSNIGSYNTLLGYRAGGDLTYDAGHNVLVGYQAGYLHTTTGNIFLGYRAGYQESGSNKLFIENSMSSSPLIYGEFDNDYVKINGDFQATGELRDSGGDAGTGGQLLSSTVSGTDWVDAGGGATEINDLTDGKTTGNSTFLGALAGQNDNGFNLQNVGIGIYSLARNTTGSHNTALGYEAGKGIIDQNMSGNIFIGYQAGSNATGDNKLYIENSNSSSPLIYGEFDNDKIIINGELQTTGITRDSGGDAGTSGQVLSSTVTGTNWVDATSGATEINDLSDGKTDGNSVFLGSGAGENDDGILNYNIGIGKEANYYNVAGNQNTIIGVQAGRGSSSHNKSGNVFLGYRAGYFETGNNTLYIENSSSSTPLIYGEFINGKIVINGDFQATGFMRDSSSDVGIGGQVLSATGTGTNWIYGSSLDAADGTPSDVVYVDNAGNVGISDTTPSYKLDVNGDLRVNGMLRDSAGDIGANGQVLSSTGSYINWVDAATGDITDVTAGTGLNGGGTSGNVTLNIDVPLNLTGSISYPNSVIKGENSGTGYGVLGKHNSSGNYGSLGFPTFGVYGYNNTTTGYAVYGNSTGYYSGYFNSNYNHNSTHVIHAEFTGTSFDAIAVYGKSRPQDGYGYGGYFEGGRFGVYSTVLPDLAASGIYFGAYGSVYGGSGINYGIYCSVSGSGTNYAGYFDGNVTVTGTFSNPSDERFKENVQPFTSAISKINLMNVHTFNFKQLAEEKHINLPKGNQIGLIAQELEEIIPELVVDNVHVYDKNEGIEGAEKDMEKIEYKGINYIGLIPVLIEAMKEQQQQIEELQQQIAELR
ncbi:MAG: tail fiber domain-containing protein, partial [Candidatus Cloacimonadota bacterium]|nr:tail fiber domain-containing protein [Candidatus Cloacimonadota bacterium]